MIGCNKNIYEGASFTVQADMLTWWLQADLHFNDEDYFQQNLQYTLQAMAMDIKSIVSLNMHEEIAPDISVIVTGQLSTWLSCSIVKGAIYTTGKGDIVFRLLFASDAKSFLVADQAIKFLKQKLEFGLYTQFGLCLGSKLVSTTLIATMDSEETPSLKPILGKQLVLMLAVDECHLRADEITQVLSKEYVEFEDYSTPEVEEIMDTYASDELSPLSTDTPPSTDSEMR